MGSTKNIVGGIDFPASGNLADRPGGTGLLALLGGKEDRKNLPNESEVCNRGIESF